jgi:peptide/nickel transport system permease protein
MLMLIAFRFSTVINTLVLLFYFVKLIFNDPVLAYGQFSFDLFDYLFSTLAALSLIAVIISTDFRDGWLKKKLSFLSKRISFTSLAVIVLFICYVFAPLAAEVNPDFQKNINVTHLLSPFSTVSEIISNKSNAENKSDTFMIMKEKVIKNSFDNHLMFADSIVKSGSQIIFYQKGMKNIFLSDNFNGIIITSKMFLLGTDEFGRDIFSRLIYGARVSLTIGLLSVLITFLLGTLLGFFAGYTGGIVDLFLNRLSDMFLSFPVIFLIILILALFGNSVFILIVVLGLSGWMSLFKIVRSEIISLKKRDYFMTAKLMGTGSLRMIFYEMLPVIAAPVIVNLVFQFGNVILAESALSYLGLGTGGNIPSWGSMIEAGQSYIYRAWWMIIFPGLALFLSLFIINNLGNRIKTIINPWLRND